VNRVIRKDFENVTTVRARELQLVCLFDTDDITQLPADTRVQFGTVLHVGTDIRDRKPRNPSGCCIRRKTTSSPHWDRPTTWRHDEVGFEWIDWGWSPQQPASRLHVRVQNACHGRPSRLFSGHRRAGVKEAKSGISQD